MAETVLIKAVDLAREVAIEAAEDAAHVGDHLAAVEVDERLVTHQFAALIPGYRGWIWEVTVSRAPRGKEAAICEAYLTPADDALLAPAWVPWADRVQPGDLDAHMVLPYLKDDPRVVPGYEITDDADADQVALWELGLGRERVLGAEGRELAADRWYRGSHGPTAASAIASAEQCATCAFMIPIAGSLRGTFGVCANEWSPSDGSVVSLDHGCGAHSQTDLDKQASRWPADAPVVDTMSQESLDTEASADEAPADEEPAADAPEAKSAPADAAPDVAEAPEAEASADGEAAEPQVEPSADKSAD